MESPDIWPTHAYVPGKTKRHPEDAFIAVQETVHAGLTPVQLAKSQAFCLALRYIHAGYYWEAHELLEPVWMALPKPGEERRFVQAMIQIANGFLKIKMGRPKAALRLEEISRNLLVDMHHRCIMGVSMDEVEDLLKSLRFQINVEI